MKLKLTLLSPDAGQYCLAVAKIDGMALLKSQTLDRPRLLCQHSPEKRH